MDTLLNVDVEENNINTPNQSNMEDSTQPVKSVTNSSDSSDSDTEPVIKKKRTASTARGLRRQRTLPASITKTSTNNTTHKTRIYSGVEEKMSAFRKSMSQNAVLNMYTGGDIEEEEGGVDEAFSFSKKKRTSERHQIYTKEFPINSKSDGDSCILTDAEQTAPEVKVVESPVRARSPSPPPPPTNLIFSQPNVKRHKATDKAIRELDILQCHQRMSAYQSQMSDIMNDLNRSSDVIVVTPEKRDLMVRVKSRSGIQRFPMKPDSRFVDIMKAMAEHEGVSIQNILMYISGKDAAIQPQDTPSSLNLHIADIIECHIQKQSLDTSSFLQDSEEFQDENILELKIQGCDPKSRLTFSISKFEPLEKILRQFATQRELDYNKLSFKFDDEPFSASQCAEELDMENDDCIDVIGA